MDDITNGWETGDYIPDNDLTLWQKQENGSYRWYRTDWMISWTISQREDGLWYWVEVNHDGWNGHELVDESIAASDEGFASWKEAARWLQKHDDLM